MKYKVAICDDNEIDAQFVLSILTLWAKERQILIQTECFSSAESFLFHYAEDKTFDILLLDIEMGELDGVEMARRIRKENETVQIVFITGYSEYIAEGYEVSALHYLMKPVKQEKLFDVLDRATKKLFQNEKCLNLTLSGEMVRIPFYEIRYLEVHQNYVTIYGKEEYKIKRTLGEFEKELDERFVRVGRAMIVNLAYITRVTKTEVYLSTKEKLPLPRGAYEPLNRAIISYT